MMLSIQDCLNIVEIVDIFLSSLNVICIVKALKLACVNYLSPLLEVNFKPFYMCGAL